jgi:hypothetical protein
MFNAGPVSILFMPTTNSDCLEKFYSNLIKFHSNFEWEPIRIFRISPNSVGSEFFSEMNPKTLSDAANDVVFDLVGF